MLGHAKNKNGTEIIQHFIPEQDKKQNMVSFFDAMKDGDPEQEARMSQVLYGGKGDIKRHHAVDKSLYGTEEGAEQQRMAVEAAAEEQSSREKAIKKKRRKKGGKKRKKKKKTDEDVAKDDKSKTDSDSDSIDKVGWNGSTAIAASGAATIGTIALAAILIGKRSQ
eukprot:431673_1